ncbi:hypothetical protein M9H77_01786 [Catharanthus roseus]|uniref:Uncharacterized protein n=1 Tax=Catharanthus roseus TaxID=4058 RepID=A0ACC0C6P7_CATRO|nr:hypothetical protein M9H77_01786 [Catharanthus roseus]
MDIKNWRRFGSTKNGQNTIYLGRHFDQVVDHEPSSKNKFQQPSSYSNDSNKKMKKLKGIWRKLFLKEKNKKDVFWASRSVHVQPFPYYFDSEIYSENFDEESGEQALAEPDFAFRSFSTRPSDPSKSKLFIPQQKDHFTNLVMLVGHDNDDRS